MRFPAQFSILMLLRMVAGLLVWASAFVMLYAGHSLGCQLYTPASAHGRVELAGDWVF